MFDSSYNSAAYQRHCAEFSILKNGDRDVWIIYDIKTGTVACGEEFTSKEAAEEAIRELYDEWNGG